MSDMPKVILQVKLDPGSPKTVKAIRALLDIRPEQIDVGFGVREVRPERSLYAVRVAADVASRVRGDAPRRAGTSLPDTQVAVIH